MVNDDFSKLFKELSIETTDLSRLNYTYITLISKKADFLSVKNFRPLSLKNEIIKIISKLLSIRLSTVIDKLVGQSQTAFIKGRSISES